MSKTVFRYDRGGALRRPETTSQGFLRADGHAARVGIYEYRGDGGKITRELRPAEEVFHPDSLASYDAAPITIEHPADKEVNAENVRRHEVGTVSGAGRRDGDHVAITTVIKDARAIKLVKAGKQELSPGYKIELDETPGADIRYAYPGNPTGRYDAVQRNIRVNHQALVDRARGGSTIRLRMDAAERADACGKLTTVVNGHQHLLDLEPQYGSRSSGQTSWSVSGSEKAEHGHAHDWIRNADGSITIGMSEDHTHTILDDSSWSSGISTLADLAAGARADAQIDRSSAARESHRMDKDEQIRSLKEQLAVAEARLTPVVDAARKDSVRADSAEATIKTLQEENSALRAQIAAAAQVIETEAIKREKVRADSAELALRQVGDQQAAAIEARVALERKAAVVMPDLNMRGISDRQIIATVVKRLDAQQDIGPSVSDAYLQGRLDSLLQLHERNARDLQRVGDIVNNTQNEQRADSLEEKRRELRNQGTAPLPNSREAQFARGRA